MRESFLVYVWKGSVRDFLTAPPWYGVLLVGVWIFIAIWTVFLPFVIVITLLENRSR